MTTFHDRPNPGWAGMVLGVMIVVLGIILFFDQTGLFGWRPSLSLWPFLLIGIGLARFSTPQPDSSREGGWLIVIGSWFLLNDITPLRVRDTWPLLLIALGVHTMWKAIVRRSPPGISGYRS
jgi:uncharacterized membrane protein HdeD (DUF308 family)